MAVTEFQKLPDANSSTIELVHPTPEEQLQAWTNNSVAWKGAFDLENYLQREQYLVNAPLARDGGVTHWILVESHLPPNERTILGSCESLRKKALVRDHNGNVREVMTHGIGSVFAPPEFRGRGYAGRMMSELGKKLATWQKEESEEWRKECLFSILYSDIGKKFYASFGWHPYSSVHFSFPPVSATEMERTATALSREDLPELTSLDEQNLRKRLETAPVDGKTHIALIPNLDTMRWHHTREDWVTKKLFGKSPEIKGAIAGEVGHRVWAIWTRAYSEPVDGNIKEGNTLYILRLVIEDEEAGSGNEAEQSAHLRDVLSLAQEQAAEWNLSHVELWNPTTQARKLIEKTGMSHAEVHREAESIPALRWYGDDNVKAEDIDWILNEKFGWC